MIICIPKLDAAPADAPIIRAPTQTCKTPKQKTRALFHHGVLIFLTFAFGSTGKPLAAKLLVTSSKSSSFPAVLSMISVNGT